MDVYLNIINLITDSTDCHKHLPLILYFGKTKEKILIFVYWLAGYYL